MKHIKTRTIPKDYQSVEIHSYYKLGTKYRTVKKLVSRASIIETAVITFIR